MRVPDFEAAIAEANQTAYGPGAAVFSDDPACYDRFRREIRAGIVNWNR